MTSAIELTRAYAQAMLVDREALAGYQETNDTLMAAQTLKRAFRLMCSPYLLALASGRGLLLIRWDVSAERLSR